MAKGLLIVMMDIDPEVEEEFNRWYNEEHVPELMVIPGFLRARRFRAVEGKPRYLAMFDLESPDVLKSEAYLKLPVTEWRQRMRPHFRNLVRVIHEEIRCWEPG